MKATMTTGLRIAAWSTAALVAMGVAAGTASAVAGHHNGGPGGGPGGPGGPGIGGPNVVHAIATVKINKKFRKVAEQTGTVSDVNDESITVTSADEYAATYVIVEKTKICKNGKKVAISKIADGDKVEIQAIKKHGAFEAELVLDGKPPRPKGGPGQGGPFGAGGQGGPGGEGGQGGQGPGGGSGS